MAGYDYAKARRLFDLVHPGLFARLDKYGGNLIDPRRSAAPLPTLVLQRDNTLSLSTAVRIDTPKFQLRIHSTSREGIVWKPVHFSYHYASGPNTDDLWFRIDFEHGDRHFHLRNHLARDGRFEHIPFALAQPELTDDPLDFLDLVDRHLETGTIPIRIR